MKSQKISTKISLFLIFLAFFFFPIFSKPVLASSCGDNSCDFPETSSTCPADCGCHSNGVCEAERGENSWNCPDDCKTIAEANYCICRANPKHLGGAGLVPCGRKADDLDTSNCECCPCTLCHVFLMLKKVTDFLTKDLFFPLLLLAIIIAGTLHIFGAIKITDIAKAKAVLTAGAIGTMVIFTSWITINFFLYFMTHQKTNEGIATIFGQPWNEVSCNYPTGCLTAFCGDGIVQRPNAEGTNEECEPEERWEAFKARAQMGEAVDVDNNGATDEHDYFASICSCEDCHITGDVSSCCGNGRLEAGEECDPTVSQADWLASGYAKDYSGDGNIDSVDYNLMKHVCTGECKLGCLPSDPHFADINKGCYQPEGSSDSCQKGVWACDSNTGVVKCLDVYSTEIAGYEDYYIGEELYDYCCESIENQGGDVTWGQTQLNSLSGLTRVKPSAAVSGSGSFYCDDICRKQGKICVGVGLTDNPAKYCYAVSCHSGNNCTASANNVKEDCRTKYPYYDDPDFCGYPESYHVGYTSCLCWSP